LLAVSLVPFAVFSRIAQAFDSVLSCRWCNVFSFASLSGKIFRRFSSMALNMSLLVK
jgi:hypothetical protein